MSSLEVSSFLEILNKHPVCRPLCFPFMCSLAASELHKSVPWYIYRSRCGRQTDSSPVSFKKTTPVITWGRCRRRASERYLMTANLLRAVELTTLGLGVLWVQVVMVPLPWWHECVCGGGTIWMEDDCFERIAGPLSLEQQDRDSGFIFLVLQNQAKQKTQCSSDSCMDQIRTQQQYSAWERVCHRCSTAFSCTKKELKCVL